MPRYGRNEWEPITIYISINAEDAKAFATITGIFVDSANAYLVAYGPNSIDDRGNQLGPHSFFFLLDETPTLPKLTTVTEGPAVGRSKAVSYAIVGQDFSQLESRYSKADVETLKSTTAIKVILSQNNEAAARTVSQMAGNMTFKKANYTMKDHGDPISKFLDVKKEIISGDHWEKREFIDTSFVMSMPSNKHIVLVQNFMSRPILADTPKFFLEKEIMGRVYNLRTGAGPRPALPMPRHMMTQASTDADEQKKVVAHQRNMSAILASPDIVVVVTPQNISDVTRDLAADGVVNRKPLEAEFAIARIKIEKTDQFFDVPSDDDITVTSDPEEVLSSVRDKRVVVFSRADGEALRGIVSGAGGTIEPELLTTVRREALDIGKKRKLEDTDEDLPEDAEEDIFTVGYYGFANCDVPSDLGLIDARFGARWLCEILTIVHGYKFELENMAA